ncbi:PD-(D/E)XK nuclease family protein [Nonlabens antarcticus]|uniref:PD-(D/E)XK nuclease family protein n=1 Tax=Nonlabens antarcticus TaxID=392714 RepID=UPI0018913580|nr:PD-(D/E)XK nuclease family protein [Nonlabens antarcticus]
MHTFIETVLNKLTSQGIDPVSVHYVVPSRRVGVFLNKAIAKKLSQPVFEPQTQSIEDFIQEKSGLHILADLDILPYFYQAYCMVEPEGKRDNFDTFIGWAPTILQDFNEIDRYLVDTEQFFDYLGNFKALDTDRHWSLDANPTQMITQYLSFWKQLYKYYTSLTEVLFSNKVAYQGLAYRTAFAKAQSVENPEKTQELTVFIGLNALNTAESKIIQLMLNRGNSLIFWDADTYFIDRSYHEAGKFIREHRDHWSYYKGKELDFISQNYSEPKELNFISTTGNLGMVQAASSYLSVLSEAELKETAVILADEALLLPLLSAMPDNVKAFNITMGLSLDQLPISSFFLDIFKLHKEHSVDGFYYKNIIRVLESSFASILSPVQVSEAIQKIRRENLIYVNLEKLRPDTGSFLHILMTPLKDPKEILKLVDQLLEQLKKQLMTLKNSKLELEQLLGMTEVQDELIQLVRENNNINDLRTLAYLLRQILPLKKLDFIGEPIKGLQLMGLLETRALDFKNVIMLSVNEGVLPAGKSHSSYIPYEMKRSFGLPTYTEKDSVYAYHFYRLLHRCDQATFIYNSESDTLGGGEKSRFLLQLETDTLPNHKLTQTNYYHKVNAVKNELIQITKNDLYFDRLKEIAAKGFSPSSLTGYVRNPIDFFANKILSISDLEDVEEDIALNTMGSIIHEALDRLYQKYQKIVLTDADFKLIEKQIPLELDLAYKKCYLSQSQPTGKNKIIYEVSLHYVKKMINSDRELVAAGRELIIESVEQELSTSIEIPKIGIIKLHGKIDRVDRLDGTLRIIDYKSGSVNQRNVAVDNDYSVLISDYERSKAFQVLMYAYLYMKSHSVKTAEAGIISFKNFNSGFISFAVKPKTRFELKTIDNEVLDEFEIQLIDLIRELFNPEIPLIEKPV